MQRREVLWLVSQKRSRRCCVETDSVEACMGSERLLFFSPVVKVPEDQLGGCGKEKQK